jgi:serine/threonine-protein kinase
MVERKRSSAGDPPLRTEADSVDSLMRALAHVPSLGFTGLSALRDTSCEESLDADELEGLPRVGDVMGERYLLISVLGRGGMGAVYAARHLGTGREVAVKVLLPETRSDSMRRERVARFVREARAAGRVRHPNVVDVYDVDGKDELPYLVMERLHGESLGQRLRRGPLPLSEALRILLDAMRGVAEAHRQGVIHRDLKPDNIFLVMTSAAVAPIAKVLDFGVSRIVMAEHGEPKSTTLTRAGHLLGTFEYMPLEQLRGAATVDARADVYALGVILYEAIAGVRPYKDAANERDLSVRLATEEAVPLRTHLPGISPALADVVARALQRDPENRYPSVESFASELARVSAGAQPVAHAARGEKQRASRRRVALWMALALSCMLALLGGLSVWRRSSPRSNVASMERSDPATSPPPLPAVVSRAPAPSAPLLMPRATPEPQPAPSEHERASEQRPTSDPRLRRGSRSDSKLRAAREPSKLTPAKIDRPTLLLKSDF